jgi:DNA-binding transcriptional ArsR family regulator
MSSTAEQPVASGDSDGRERSVERPPTRDELFSVLQNRRRRFAIHHLKQASGPVDVGTLATQVAAWENQVPVERVTAKQRRRVYNALQQTHIPTLEQTGIVTVNRREVSLTDRADESDLYVEIVPGEDIPWSKFYLALGGLGLVLFALVRLGVGPFGAVGDVAVGAFLSIAVLLSAGAHYYYQMGNRLGNAAEPPGVRQR